MEGWSYDTSMRTWRCKTGTITDLELFLEGAKKVSSFYLLPRDERWLDRSDEIGGRSTDIGQLGCSLREAVKNKYPINGVPIHIVKMLESLQKVLDDGERMIEVFIELVSNNLLGQLGK